MPCRDGSEDWGLPSRYSGPTEAEFDEDEVFPLKHDNVQSFSLANLKGETIVD